MPQTTTSSEKGSGGCLGCLGSLVLFTLVGSIFFGGGVLMRVGQWRFALGQPVDTDSMLATYWDDLARNAKIADDAAQRVNTQLEQGKCPEIYEQASEIFKSTVSQSNLVSICTALKSQIGSFASAEQIDWWGKTGELGDSYIFTRYKLNLSKLTVQESFIWLVKDGKAELINFQIFPIQGLPAQNSILPKSPVDQQKK